MKIRNRLGLRLVLWVLILWALVFVTAASADDEKTSPSNQPTIIINNNYGSPPPQPVPSPLTAVPAPTPVPTPPPVITLPAQAPQCLAEANPSGPDNGFGLTFEMGTSSLGSVDLGVRADARFLDYLGMELRGMHSLSGAHDRLGAFFKMQIPFKSRIINFTPSAGIGYGAEGVNDTSFTGTEVFLASEVEFFHFLVVKAEYGQGIDGNLSVTPPSNLNPSPSNPPARYGYGFLGVGFRVSPHVVLGAKYGEVVVGNATTMQGLGQLGLRF